MEQEKKAGTENIAAPENITPPVATQKEKKKPSNEAKPKTPRPQKAKAGKEGATKAKTAPSGTPPADGWEVARVLKVTKPLMKGDDVKALQAALIAHNYHCGIEGASGTYEKNTAYAVRCFQSFRGLVVDGKAGRYTVAALGGTWTA